MLSDEKILITGPGGLIAYGLAQSLAVAMAHPIPWNTNMAADTRLLTSPRVTTFSLPRRRCAWRR